MSSDMNEGGPGTDCPLDGYPCEGQGTDVQCSVCVPLCKRIAELEAALRDIEAQAVDYRLDSVLMRRAIRETARAVLEQTK